MPGKRKLLKRLAWVAAVMAGLVVVLLIAAKFWIVPAVARRQIREGALAISFAQDGLEAIEQLEAMPDIDVVLTDINMPRMDGHEALQKIRERESGSVVVVMLTTSSQEEDVMRGYNLGVNSYLRKPLDPDDFTTLAERFGNYWLRQSELPAR